MDGWESELEVLERLLEEGRDLLDERRAEEVRRIEADLAAVDAEWLALENAIREALPAEMHRYIDLGRDREQYLMQRPAGSVATLRVPGLAPIVILFCQVGHGRFELPKNGRYVLPAWMEIDAWDGDPPYYVRVRNEAVAEDSLAVALARAAAGGPEYDRLCAEVDRLNVEAAAPAQPEKPVQIVDHLAEARRTLSQVGDYAEDAYYQYAPVELQQVCAHALVVIAEQLVNWSRFALSVEMHGKE